MSRTDWRGRRARPAACASARVDGLLGRETLRNRMIATAYFRDGYSIRDIALAWRLSPSRVHGIIKRLRQTLTDTLGTPSARTPVSPGRK